MTDMDARSLSWIALLFVDVVYGSAVEDFDAIQREFGEWRVAQYPEDATIRGIYKYNDVLENYNLAHLENLKTATDGYMTRLQAVSYDQLPVRKQLDYDILKSTMKTLLDGYIWRHYGALNSFNHMEGPQRDPNYIVSTTPLDTRGDFENYIARLEAMPKQMDEMRDLFKKAIQDKKTLNIETVRKMEPQFVRILTDTPEQFAYYIPFTDALDNLTSINITQRADIKQRGRTAVQGALDSFKAMQTYINTTYRANVRSGLGVSGWENGSEYYKACLRWHTTLDISPEEVHQMGLNEVKRISGNMRNIMAKLGFTDPSIRAFFESLQGDPRFFKSNKSQIMDLFNDMIFNKIDPTLTKMFKDIPDLPVRVLESPTDGSLGYYRSGSDDGSRPGTFYINLFRPTEMSTIAFMALAIHETNPGHHFQISISNTADLQNYRKYRAGGTYGSIPYRFPSNTAYIEGWALYAEYLGEELGLYEDDYDMMGRYSSEIFRACRLVVDTGIHYFNWTKTEAVEYMLNYTSRERAAVENEIDRYSVWPGQACSYKVGEIKIRQLRTKAENELGDKFDIKEFHSVVLRDGIVSLNTLETMIDKWIQDTKMTDSNTDNCISASSNTISSVFTLSVVLMAVLNSCVQ